MSYHDPPPRFALYDASYSVSGSTGNVFSHDKHLNDDGEALYRFILAQAPTPPRLFLHCRGSHDETRIRFVPSESSVSQEGDRDRLRTEQYTETVVDFDFKIDVGQHILPGDLTHWSAGDAAPAYRGRMFREVGIGSEKRKAKSSELKAAKAWDAALGARGYAPWISNIGDQPYVAHDNSVLKSSWTFRQWADDYCSSNKFFKEFEYRKVVYGWDFDALVAATRSLITSTHYRGDIQVSFETLDSVISVRSHNCLSRALSNGWMKFLLIITLVYPFLWLFRRFHARGGGIWRVCGGAYALKRVDPMSPPPAYPGDSKGSDILFSDAGVADNVGQASGTVGPSAVPAAVTGLKEGTWFAQWEVTIKRAVLNRLQESDPLVSRDDTPPPIPIMLDGYYDHPPFNVV